MLVREPFTVRFQDWWEGFHDGLVANVYARPSVHDDPGKPYWPKPHVDPDNPETGSIDYHQLFELSVGSKMRVLGFAEEDIEARFRNWFKSYNR